MSPLLVEGIYLPFRYLVSPKQSVGEYPPVSEPELK